MELAGIVEADLGRAEVINDYGNRNSRCRKLDRAHNELLRGILLNKRIMIHEDHAVDQSKPILRVTQDGHAAGDQFAPLRIPG